MGLLDKLQTLSITNVETLTTQMERYAEAAAFAATKTGDMVAALRAARNAEDIKAFLYESGLAGDYARGNSQGAIAARSARSEADAWADVYAVIDRVKTLGNDQGLQYLDDAIARKQAAVTQLETQLSQIQKKYDDYVAQGLTRQDIINRSPNLITGLESAKTTLDSYRKQVEALQNTDPALVESKLAAAYIDARKDGLFSADELKNLQSLSDELKALRETFTQTAAAPAKTYEIKLSTGQSIRSTTDPTDFLAALEAAQRSAR